jgi:hypothetical protein
MIPPTPNSLRLLRVEPATVHVSRSIEAPTAGVAILELGMEHEGGRSLAPLHWRIGDWQKPPLDISLHPSSGALEEVQIVFQDERIEPGWLHPAPDELLGPGLPYLMPESLTGSRYIDVRGEVTAVRNDATIQIMWGHSSALLATILVSQDFRLYIDRDHLLTGFEIGRITVDEWRILSRAQAT